MTTNKQKASGAAQPPADERNLTDPSPTNIILKPLDADSVVALMESWENDPDEAEQRETFAYLKQVLDEDRLSDRKLFP